MIVPMIQAIMIDDMPMRMTMMKQFCSKATGLLQENKDPATHHLDHSSTGISISVGYLSSSNCISGLYLSFIKSLKACLIRQTTPLMSFMFNCSSFFRSLQARATVIVRSERSLNIKDIIIDYIRLEII